jgi:hypothetical protein
MQSIGNASGLLQGPETPPPRRLPPIGRPGTAATAPVRETSAGPEQTGQTQGPPVCK